MEGSLNLSTFEKPQVQLTASSHEACLGFTLLGDLDEFLLEKLSGKKNNNKPSETTSTFRLWIILCEVVFFRIVKM